MISEKEKEKEKEREKEKKNLTQNQNQNQKKQENDKLNQIPKENNNLNNLNKNNSNQIELQKFNNNQRRSTLINQKNLHLMGEENKEKTYIKEEEDNIYIDFWKLQEDFTYSLIEKFNMKNSNKISNKFLNQENYNEKNIIENKNFLFNKLEKNAEKLNVTKCCKIFFGVFFCFFFPLLILFLSIFLGIYIGFVNILIGVLLLIVGAFFPFMFILYLISSDVYKKNLYWFLFSLLWISIMVIFKGVYEIIKGIFYGFFLFFRAFGLICSYEINNHNTFCQNLRLGLGNLKMKEITLLNKFFENKIQKEIVIL
jgi:hypothetical protein